VSREEYYEMMEEFVSYSEAIQEWLNEIMVAVADTFEMEGKFDEERLERLPDVRRKLISLVKYIETGVQ